MDLFVEEMTQTAFVPDGLASSHPVFVPVSHPDEINEIFDMISYRKVIIIIIIIIILVYFPFVYIKSIIKTSHDQTNYKENRWQYKSN